MSPDELRQYITQVGSIQQSMNDGECIRCPSVDNAAKYAIESFWKNDLYNAFRCCILHAHALMKIHT